MRPMPILATAFLLAAPAAGFAQTAPVPPATPYGHAFAECMAPQRAAVRPQVMEQMRQWRAANPAATEEARKQERRAIAMPLLAFARQQCAAAARSGTANP